MHYSDLCALSLLPTFALATALCKHELHVVANALADATVQITKAEPLG